ncbi:MAG TPA: hypothetical protein VE174_10245 [Actinomycetota bacterium]|nr:hypothetical protein [Actinomycetota bacterium]
MKLVLGLVAGIALFVLGSAYGYVRAGVGIVFFLAVFMFGFKYWRDVGLIPPEPERTDVRDQGLKYVCGVCGLELRVEIAARDRAPNHCAEPMQLVTDGDQAPLRPV